MTSWHEYKVLLRNGQTRQGLIVQAGDRFGDVCPLPGFSRETFAEACEETKLLLPQFPHVKPTLPSVQFAFDCLKCPIPKQMVVNVCALNEVKPGFSCVKLKVGNLSLEETVRRIGQVPQTVRLRLDFNRQWPLEKLLKLTELFPKERFDYLEEPTKLWSDVLLFSTKTNFPVALDESIPEFPYDELPSLEALVVKPTILGGIPKCPKGVRLVFSSAYESGIGILHLARLSLEHAPHEVHGLDTYSQVQNDVLEKRPELSAGKLTWTH
jgi:O-succinylbenzoate synthase